jgi:hypothetical protein
MEIVIKIDDERYKDIQRIAEVQLDRGRFQTAEQVIANGTPLPKGHGDLKDANELKKAYDERITYLYTLNKKDNPSREAKICATNWCVNTIDELPTIIEADKESEGKE